MVVQESGPEPGIIWQRDKGKHRPLRHQTGPTLTSHHEEATEVPGALGLGLRLTDEFQILKVLVGAMAIRTCSSLRGQKCTGLGYHNTF